MAVLGNWWLAASSQQCTFFSYHAGFSGKTSHHPGLSVPLQPRFGSLWLLAFQKAKITVEREEICECDSHTVHKVSQQRLIADWLAPWESDCSWMCSKVSSDWLPSYIKATLSVLKILKMDRYFLDRPRTLIDEKQLTMQWSMLLFAVVKDKKRQFCPSNTWSLKKKVHTFRM